MEKGKFAEKPLLYIHQEGTVELPKAPMQHHYFSGDKHVQKDQAIREESIRTRLRPLQKSYWLDEDNQVDDDDKMAIVDDSDEEQEKKRFIEMNLQEKIEYFINRSNHGLELRCELKTSDQAFRGVITDFRDDQVFIRVGKRSSSTKVPIESIEDIHLLGF